MSKPIPDYQQCGVCDYQFNVTNDFDYDVDTAVCECGNDNQDELNHVFSMLLIDSYNGIYIPNKFFKNFDFKAWGLNKSDYMELSDVEHELYHESWDLLLNNAKYEKDGLVYRLEQDNDLFMRCYIPIDEYKDLKKDKIMSKCISCGSPCEEIFDECMNCEYDKLEEK